MRPWLYSLLVLSTACSEPTVAESTDSDTAAQLGPLDQSRVLKLAGDLRTHDPSILQDGPDWYVFSTGDPAVANGTIQIRRSHDLLKWEYAGNVFDQIPAWATAAVPGVTNLWAPEIHKHGNTYYLYYSVSTFGSNRSAIGLATNTTLDPRRREYRWVDRGLVTASGPENDYNAIDPAVIEDDRGTPYLALGSFWSGIRMFKLQYPSGMLAPNQGQPLRLADRFVPPNAIEGASIVRKNGMYYMFVALDFCCRGTESTYKIAVGRSDVVTGPYYDQLGTPLQHGGGTVLLSENGTMFGPGGPTVTGDLLGYHYYDAGANGDFKLGLRTIVWKDGWPSVAAPTDLRF